MSVQDVANKLAGSYSDSPMIRGVVQLVLGPPGVVIDGILSEYGTKENKRRLDELIYSIKMDIGNLENVVGTTKEELFDILVSAGRKAVVTRVKEKRDTYANIVTKYILNCSYGVSDITEAERMLNIVDKLDLLELQLLKILLADGKCEEFEGVNVLIVIAPEDTKDSLGIDITGAIVANEKFPNTEYSIISSACANLKAYGLLKDLAQGKFLNNFDTFFTYTAFAEHLNNWLLDKSKYMQ